MGASYAVLLAEQMFASGCRLLVSITSSGHIAALRPPPYFILIEKALRDEGTSYHYLPADDYAEADPALVATIGPPWRTWASRSSAARRGPPMRATAKPPKLSRRPEQRVFWRSRWKRHRSTPTSTPRRAAKRCQGEANGATASLALVHAIAEAWLQAQSLRDSSPVTAKSTEVNSPSRETDVDQPVCRHLAAPVRQPA